MRIPIAVRASGLVTALGYNAPSTLAALRAGISGVMTRAWADREGGEPYRCARIVLPQRWTGVELLADLVAPAIVECLQVCREETLSEIPLLIGTAHPSRPGRPEMIESQLLDALAERLDAPLHPASRIYPAGQFGCAQALIDAQTLIAAEHARYVLIAGVDSYIDHETLDAYEVHRRVLCTGNFNGFLPGEAGSAVLLSAPVATGSALYVMGYGQAVETAPIDGSKPLRGEAMTQAVRNALEMAGVTMSDIAFRLSDLSGEHYKFKEAMFVAMRLDRSERRKTLDMWHPIEYLGEIGAAILPCLLGWTEHAMRMKYAPGRHVLCHVGSDTGERAAFVLQSGIKDNDIGREVTL
ncbi:hypothetical protein [Pseudomonas sp. RW409]|uniref:hypothetical protein n=1 Tax=Pseudomonas sp. RW409 TaxID=2202895 RepID=UPI000D73511A|nr:hypothetical protein [Pseudomonas sp. RW409]PWY36404.1 hypothetical protein DK261_28275 [Pseudomonas sp. RW409]